MAAAPARATLWATWLGLCAALGLAACGAPAPLQGFEPGEQGRVVRVIDGDALVLNTGQSVRLVGLEAPAFGRDGDEDAPHAEASKRALEDLVLGRQVRLYYSGMTRDRYDRALAHVQTIDRLGPALWVNQSLVAAGAARVRAYPDTARGSQALFDAEDQARQDKQGLWALRAYAVPDARDTAPDAGGFILVAGILGERAPPIFGDAACARRLMASGITLNVARSAMDVCDLQTGLRVEARGWLSDGRLSVNSAKNIRPQGAAAIAAGPAPAR
ncbi:MAG: thermonuclease family protein [Pseudomonadota bacterium]